MNLGWVDFNKINYKHKTKASPNAAFYLNAKKIFKKLEIIYIDNTDKMEKIRKNYKKYILSADNHPNELANEIIYDRSKTYFNESIFKNKIE